MTAAARRDPAVLMDYWPYVFAIARTQMPHADAATHEDMAADAIVRALSAWDRFEERHPSSIKSWLATIVRNLAIDRHRQATFRATLPLYDAVLASARVDAGSDLHALTLDVRAAVDAIDGEERTFAARYRDGYSHRETARYLGIGGSEPSAKSSAHRRWVKTCAQLRPLLEER